MHIESSSLYLVLRSSHDKNDTNNKDNLTHFCGSGASASLRSCPSVVRVSSKMQFVVRVSILTALLISSIHGQGGGGGAGGGGAGKSRSLMIE